MVKISHLKKSEHVNINSFNDIEAIEQRMIKQSYKIIMLFNFLKHNYVRQDCESLFLAPTHHTKYAN